LNSRPPAPQAGIIDHVSRITPVIPTSEYNSLDDHPKQEEMIINTLINMKKNGRAENTIITTGKTLKRMSKYTDLTQPEQVKTYIANAKRKDGKPLNSNSRARYVHCYNAVCQAYQLKWEMPRYKWIEHIPIIPTTENVNKIISASSKRYATIFTILAETGAEGQELHNVHRNDIDTERGIISIKGTKGHASGTYKLKAKTLEMLREYLAKNPQKYPFPRPKIMGQMWLQFRNQVADNIKQPELKTIQLKVLRNYSGARLYNQLKDPIAVMRHLRHKKLETTMHYIRAITLTDDEEEYTVKTANTIQQATELIEHGFQYITDMEGIKIFRKRK